MHIKIAVISPGDANPRKIEDVICEIMFTVVKTVMNSRTLILLCDSDWYK